MNGYERTMLIFCCYSLLLLLFLRSHSSLNSMTVVMFGFSIKMYRCSSADVKSLLCMCVCLCIFPHFLVVLGFVVVALFVFPPFIGFRFLAIAQK